MDSTHPESAGTGSVGSCQTDVHQSADDHPPSISSTPLQEPTPIIQTRPRYPEMLLSRYQPHPSLQPAHALGLSRRPISGLPLDLLARPGGPSLISNPITAPLLKLATHPDLSRPLPAVLSAGHCTPGTRFSRSPSVASLESIIAHASPTRLSKASISSLEEEANGGTPNLSAWWSSLASTFGADGLNEPESGVSGSYEEEAQDTHCQISRYISDDSTESSRSGIKLTGNLSRREADSSSSASTGVMLSNWWTGASSLVTTSGSIKLQTPNDELIDKSESAPRSESAEGRRTFRKPRHPLVLCHGLFGFDLIGPQYLPTLRISYWRGVREALEEVGYHLHRCGHVPSAMTL